MDNHSNSKNRKCLRLFLFIEGSIIFVHKLKIKNEKFMKNWKYIENRFLNLFWYFLFWPFIVCLLEDLPFIKDNHNHTFRFYVYDYVTFILIYITFIVSVYITVNVKKILNMHIERDKYIKVKENRNLS